MESEKKCRYVEDNQTDNIKKVGEHSESKQNVFQQKGSSRSCWMTSSQTSCIALTS